jgi:nucleoside-diphosphate-sugar epimerase
MKVSILGCGWLGMALGKDLVKDGIQVMGSATSIEKAAAINAADIGGFVIKLDEAASIDTGLDFWDCDVLFIASNVKLANNKGYLMGLKRLAALIASKPIKRLIFLSSISVYGEPNAVVDESTRPDPQTPSAVSILELEELFENIPKAIVLRLGGLIGPGRMPGAFFAGKKAVPNGQAPVNLIHLADCIGICKLLLSLKALPKFINAVAPDHPAKKNFYRAAALKQGLMVPEFIDELGQWKIVNCQFLEAIGYRFRVAQMDGSAEAVEDF